MDRDNRVPLRRKRARGCTFGRRSKRVIQFNRNKPGRGGVRRTNATIVQVPLLFQLSQDRCDGSTRRSLVLSPAPSSRPARSKAYSASSVLHARDARPPLTVFTLKFGFFGREQAGSLPRRRNAREKGTPSLLMPRLARLSSLFGLGPGERGPRARLNSTSSTGITSLHLVQHIYT